MKRWTRGRNFTTLFRRQKVSIILCLSSSLCLLLTITWENEFRILILFVFSTISGNIRVFCRCRPLSKDEVSSGQKCVVDFDGSSDGDIVIANGGTTKKTFKFDRVFTPNDDQGILVITLMFEWSCSLFYNCNPVTVLETIVYKFSYLSLTL